MESKSTSTRKRKPGRQRRQYTDEFKAGAVLLVLVEGRTITQVAKDLDLTRSALDGWVTQAKADAGKGPAGAVTSTEKDELIRRRRENKGLKLEREILKKAAAFIAKENA